MADISQILATTPDTSSPGAGTPAPAAAGAQPVSPTANAKGQAPAPVATGTEGKPAEAPKEERISPKLQALVRREQSALALERAAKAEKAAAAELLKKAEEGQAKIREFETLKETNPEKALELLGLSYEQLTQIKLNDGAVTPDIHVQKLKAEVDAIKKQSEDEKLSAAEAEKAQAEQREQQAVQGFQQEIGKFCEANAKEYEYIRFEGQEKLVFDVINEHYNRTIDEKTGVGKIMTIKDAADKVEAYLEQRYEKLSKLEKFQTKFSKSPEPQKPGAKPQPNASQKPKTQVTETSATPTRKSRGPITDEERVQRAISYARGLGRQG